MTCFTIYLKYAKISSRRILLIMDRKEFISELKNIKLVAHRLGYQMTKYPENSLEVLQTIFENKELLNACYGFEFDICFTKDHIPVVIHDKYIDDITDSYGLIKDYSLEELRQINFKSRKSLKNNNVISYKIVTLEEVLTFFENNILLLDNKIIKIETKDYIFSGRNNFNTKDLKAFADLINRFPKLSQNIVHLSFWPLNLLFFRKIQQKNNYDLTKNDLLCDYSALVFFTRFMSYLDNVSLRIKTKIFPGIDENNSKRVNDKIRSDLFWMNYSDAIKEKNLKYVINKYGTVGLYTLNSYDEIDEICKHISSDFFRENIEKIVITTNSPIYLKKLKK